MSPLIRSVWDRLLLGESDPPTQPGPPFYLDDIRAHVARDLETLLNTRRTLVPSRAPGAVAAWSGDGAMPQSQASVWSYGMPDLAGLGFSVSAAREVAASAIEQAIRCFEPRLRHARVLNVHHQPECASLGFVVDAWLAWRDGQERVCFDASLHAVSQRYTVRLGALRAG